MDFFIDGNLINDSNNHFIQNKNNLIIKNINPQTSLHELSKNYTCDAQYQNGTFATKAFTSISIQNGKFFVLLNAAISFHFIFFVFMFLILLY